MKRVTLAVPGDIMTPTGGYAYDRRIADELRRLEWSVDIVNLGNGFPFPDASMRARAMESLASLGHGPTIIDGLAYGVLPEVTDTMAAKPIALVHHPLALETGLADGDREALRNSERAALRSARAVIATSPSTARILAEDYAVPTAAIVVAVPGVDRPAIRDKKPSDTLRLLAVGAISPRKGYDVLVQALAELTDRDWTLTIAGALDRNASCARDLEAQIAALGLVQRVDLAGSVSREALDELYGSADAFVLASRFEGYGMAYIEAVAHGLPVIGTTAGAIPETLPHGVAILVPPDDVAALHNALRKMISEPDVRQQLAAVSARAPLPRWEDSARRIATLLERMT